MGYYVYMVRCADGSIYTGITTDVARRMAEHRSGVGRAARYTRTHPVEALAGLWGAPDRATASRLEYRLKRLSHEEKEQLVACPYDVGELTGLALVPYLPAARERLWDKALDAKSREDSRGKGRVAP